MADLSRQLTPVRMMRARLCIEPAIAREAAINASAEAIIRMKLAKERAAAAPNWADYETHDDLFHRSIAEASDNILLLALFDQLNQVRRAVAWESVVRKSERPPEGHSSYAEHDRITAAIEAHDPGAAQEVMRQHIGSVSARLFGDI
jgi:DNA-binding FadR family transcriptional regulator